MTAEDASHFDFLTRSGAVSVHFRPSVPDQAYPELLRIVEGIDSVNGLRSDLIEFANRWGLVVTID